jgi:hypothetical protein
VSLIHDRDRFCDETPIADAVEQEQHQDIVRTDDDREEHRD